jgi:hypothetical protein
MPADPFQLIFLGGVVCLNAALTYDGGPWK